MCINVIYALYALLSPFSAGKYKQGSKIAKVHKCNSPLTSFWPLAKKVQSQHAISEVSSKAQNHNSRNSLLASFSPLVKSVQSLHAISNVLASSRSSNRIRDTWSNPIWAEADFVQLANSKSFGY